jgi:hypothetical protein
MIRQCDARPLWAISRRVLYVDENIGCETTGTSEMPADECRLPQFVPLSYATAANLFSLSRQSGDEWMHHRRPTRLACDERYRALPPAR